MRVKDRVLLPISWKLSHKLWKSYYPFFSRRLGADNFLLLNTGYEEEPPMALPLEASDEPNRYCIQLYHRTATQADLSGKQVLEVGSGHGGGASYLMRTLRPTSYTGVDLNATGVAFCRKKYNLAGLDFVQGDAENLPFPDQSFDAVINIESSLHYPRFSRFLAEVARVLRPGGHFLYADFRPLYFVTAWETDLANAPMRMLSQSDISADVMRGVERNLPQWQSSFDRHGRALVPRVIRNTSITSMSKALEQLRSGELSYRMYCFDKA